MTAYLKDIPIRLRIARIAAGYHSAKKFTEEFDIPASTYSQHENGKRALTLDNVANYAMNLKVDPAWLLTGKGSPCGDLYVRELEESILMEQERLIKQGELHATAIPIVSELNKYSNIDIPVFKKILEELLPLLRYVPESKTQDVVEFCFELYNRVIVTHVEENERSMLIRLCLDSFFKGLSIKNTDKIRKSCAVSG